MRIGIIMALMVILCIQHVRHKEALNSRKAIEMRLRQNLIATSEALHKEREWGNKVAEVLVNVYGQGGPLFEGRVEPY